VGAAAEDGEDDARKAAGVLAGEQRGEGARDVARLVFEDAAAPRAEHDRVVAVGHRRAEHAVGALDKGGAQPLGARAAIARDPGVGRGRRHKGAAPRPRERLGVVAEDGDRRRVDEAVGVEPVATFVDRGVEAGGGGRRERRVQRGAPREALLLRLRALPEAAARVFRARKVQRRHVVAGLR